MAPTVMAFPNSAKIAVIVPAYNLGGYVARAVESVLAQSFGDFELVVVDDGSKDETPQVLAGIRDPRMRVVRQENAGLPAARNTGIRESTAPLVAFLDADDFYLPGMLEILGGFLAGHPEIGMVAGAVRYVDETGRWIGAAQARRTPLRLPELLFENPICVSGIVLRRSWLDRVGLFDESLRACEDYDLWLRLLAAGCRMAWVDHHVVAYRVRSGQMTSEAARMRKAIFAVLDKFFERPELPEQLAVLKDKVYARGFLHAAAFAYLSNETENGWRDLAQAMRMDPDLKAGDCKKLIGVLVAWANDPRARGAAAFLERIIETLPRDRRDLRVGLRRAAADILMAPLFGGSREMWRARRADLFRAVRYKPEWLLNRGVLRMVAETCLPRAGAGRG